MFKNCEEKKLKIIYYTYKTIWSKKFLCLLLIIKELDSIQYIVKIVINKTN